MFVGSTRTWAGHAIAAAIAKSPSTRAKNGTFWRVPGAKCERAEDHVIGGSLLDIGCPNEEEPRETPLSVV